MNAKLVCAVMMTLSGSAHAAIDAESIYKALNVSEVLACDPARGEICPNSVTTWIKSVGGLTCSKSEVMSPVNPEHYDCKLEQ